MLNCNAALFFTKWLHDLASEQSEAHGVPHVIPNILGEQDGAAAGATRQSLFPGICISYMGIREFWKNSLKA